MPVDVAPTGLTLADCSPGTCVTILTFTAPDLPLRRLAEFGLRPGVSVEVRQQHRGNGVIIAYGEERVAIAHDAAKAIRVARTIAPSTDNQSPAG